MTKLKFTSAVLRVMVATGIATAGFTAANAHAPNSMGGMQMAPGSKMDMKGMKMPAKNAVHHKHGGHHKHPAQTKPAAK